MEHDALPFMSIIPLKKELESLRSESRAKRIETEVLKQVLLRCAKGPQEEQIAESMTTFHTPITAVAMRVVHGVVTIVGSKGGLMVGESLVTTSLTTPIDAACFSKEGDSIYCAGKGKSCDYV